MSQNRYKLHHPNSVVELLDCEEWLLFVSGQHKQLTILSFGCNFDNQAIEKLIHAYSLSEVKKQDENAVEIYYESYDANQIDYDSSYFHFFTIDENHLRDFENELRNLVGYHIQCDYHIRGHLCVQLAGKNYSTLVFKTLDCSAVHKETLVGRYLFFIDTLYEDNYEIRHKIHLLPEHLQWLSLPVHFSEVEKEVYIKSWIRRIIAY